METPINNQINKSRAGTVTKQVAINSLAVVGFITIISVGVWLAVYSVRFIPTISTRASAAAVYLGSIFKEPKKTSLPEGIASTQETKEAKEQDKEQPTVSKDVSKETTNPEPKVTPEVSNQIEPGATTAGEKTSSTYQIGGSTKNVIAPNGLPDLTVKIIAVGYMTTTSTDSFVANKKVPAGNRPAVRFTIENIGTNKSGEWRFNASIPAQNAYLFQSPPQQSLNPGESIDYTLGFDESNKGINQTISISANFDRAIKESNVENNNASDKLEIL